MHVIYLSFLSFVIAALCAPSAASVQQDLTSTSDFPCVTGTIAPVPETGLDDVIAKRVDDACTDCSGATTITTIAASPTSAAVASESGAPANAPAPLNSGLSDASSASSGNPSIGGLYSHALTTFGHFLDLTDALISLLLAKEQEMESGLSVDEDSGTVKRRADSTAGVPQYAGDTPTVRELFSHNLRICGRTLDGADRVVSSAYTAATSAMLPVTGGSAWKVLLSAIGVLMYFLVLILSAVELGLNVLAFGKLVGVLPIVTELVDNLWDVFVLWARRGPCALS